MHFSQKVNRKVGKNIIAKGDEILELPRIPTGSLSLDVETGGGIPRGRITSLVGEWSSGKTTVALRIVSEYQRRWPDEDIYWIDAEGVWDPTWAKTFGIDVPSIYVVRPENAQQAYNIALEAVEEKAGLMVIDSVAALSPKEELENDMDKVTVALMARLNSKFMRKLQTGLSDDQINTTLIYLNQLRKNVDGYGSPWVEPGGEALNFYPSLKIILKKGEYFDGKKEYKSITANDEGVEVKAQVIKFYTEKNKTAPPKRRGHFWFYFDTLDKIRHKGTYDRLEEVIRYTKKYDIVRQRGSIFDLVNPKTGELRSFKGSNELAKYIRDNANTQQWVEEAVMERVRKEMTGDEEILETARKVAEIAEPVVRLRTVGDDEAEGDEGSEEARSAEGSR